MLDLRRLRLLHELRHRGTLAAVAQARHISPSAVSQHLTELEREVGVPLTEKVGRGVRLTDAGLLLADHAAAILAQVEEAEAAVQSHAGQVVGEIRIASPQTASVNIVPRAIALMRERHPGVTVRTETMETPDGVEAVRVGEFDLAIGVDYGSGPPPQPTGVVRRELLVERLLLAMHAGHPLGRRRGAVDVSGLRDEIWAAALHGEQAHALTAVCREAGFEPEIRHRSDDLLILLAIAAAGGAVTLIPEILLPREAPDVVLRAIRGSQPHRTLFMVRRDGTERPAVAATMAAVTEAAQEIVGRRALKA